MLNPIDNVAFLSGIGFPKYQNRQRLFQSSFMKTHWR